MLVVGANAFVLSPILSEVAEGLASAPARIAWAISAFGAATAVSALTLAGMVDRMPAGRVLGGAALLLAMAQVASWMRQGWVSLCLSQAVAEVATGVLLPGAYATAAATAPAGRAAARLGVVLTGWALSLVLAVPAAALIAEHLGWRAVYVLLPGFSGLVAIGLMLALRGVRGTTSRRPPPWQALRRPGVGWLLVVVFAYMTAFYGSFAFFGEGARRAFGLSVQDTGLFVLAYGLGFGLAEIGLGIAAPRVSRRYVILVLVAIAASYASWGLALAVRPAAFAAAMGWGALNQLGLNALAVSLDHCAGEARGAVMGLNSAVTYSAVFAGPVVMGPAFSLWGFPAVTALAALVVLGGALIGWRVP